MLDEWTGGVCVIVVSRNVRMKGNTHTYIYTHKHANAINELMKGEQSLVGTSFLWLNR